MELWGVCTVFFFVRGVLYHLLRRFTSSPWALHYLVCTRDKWCRLHERELRCLLFVGSAIFLLHEGCVVSSSEVVFYLVSGRSVLSLLYITASSLEAPELYYLVSVGGKIFRI